MTKSFSFPKQDKLCGEIRIGKLFSEGKGFIVYPLRVVYREVKAENIQSPLRLMISVPKKKVRKAVHRNYVKRLIREAYRINRVQLLKEIASSGMNFDLAVIYLTNEIIPFSQVNEKMTIALQKLQSIMHAD